MTTKLSGSDVEGETAYILINSLAQTCRGILTTEYISLIGRCDRADDKWHKGPLHTGEFVQVAALAKMMVSVHLGEWAWFVMTLHSGAAVVVRLQFTETKTKVHQCTNERKSICSLNN